MFIILIFTIFAICVVFATPTPITRIVGGNYAEINDFPYQISMQLYNKHICGGSIISSRYIITAAHCTEGMSPSMLNIRAGSTYHAAGGQNIRVYQIIQHPNYDPATQDYDISILVLERDLIFGDGVQPIDLPHDSEDVAIGDKTVCSGWGRLNENGVNPSGLMYVVLEIISRIECSKYYNGYGLITNQMICTSKRGKDACQGDSGGPLALNNKLVGVVSWGIGCAHPNFPGVFADVSRLRNFIRYYTGL